MMVMGWFQNFGSSYTSLLIMQALGSFRRKSNQTGKKEDDDKVLLKYISRKAMPMYTSPTRRAAVQPNLSGLRARINYDSQLNTAILVLQ